jgi:DNA mismatch endonuclease (patch repair protein)
MQNIRSKDTLPERLIISALKKKKIYFATYVASLPGKPDIVFRRKKIAIFIDSDFWHAHPKRFIRPLSNTEYWDKKIAMNKARDKKVNKELKKIGWKVLRYWEYDVKKNTDKIISLILAEINI